MPFLSETEPTRTKLARQQITRTHTTSTHIALPKGNRLRVGPTRTSLIIRHRRTIVKCAALPIRAWTSNRAPRRAWPELAQHCQNKPCAPEERFAPSLVANDYHAPPDPK